MFEGLFSPLHLLILLLLALVIFGIPLLLIVALARWLDKRLQRQMTMKVSILGVVIGGITDIVTSNLLAIPFLFYVMTKHGLLHEPVASGAIASAIHSNAWLYGLELAIGLGCSVLGGYVAASIAKHDELLNGLLSSLLCTAIGIYSVVWHKDSQSLLSHLLLLAAAPAFAFLGGYLRHTRKRVDLVRA